MYNMIIADDEEAIREGITRLIRTVFPQIQIQSVCKNGQEVIDRLSNGTTDLLIIDINMPVKSGLEVARFIHERGLPVYTVMITGYAQFEYAKAAIDYKVESFFQKPFDSEQMIEVIHGILQRIDSDRAAVADDTRNYLQSHIKNKDLLALGYAGVLSPQNIALQRSFFPDRPLDELFICELKFYFTPLPDAARLQTDLSGFGEFSCAEFASYLMDVQEDTFLFLLVMPEKDPRIIERFTAELQNSFQLFYHAALQTTPPNFFHFDAWSRKKKDNKIITDYLENLQKKRVSFALEDLKNNLAGRKSDELAAILAELKARASHTLACTPETEPSAAGCTVDDFAALHRELSVELSKSYDIILRIKKYVYENYANSTISLANIARELHMNETYISRLFKEKTGQRFVDFLIDVRINNAKELLATGKHTVNDVAHAVGYSQVKHFRTIFKKHTGITASEYTMRSVVGGYEL